MKNLLHNCGLLLALPLLLVCSGCFKDSITRTYSIMRPVYETRANVLANIKGGEPQTLVSPGKIFIRGNYIFINEVNKGVHIIDNSNPSSPQSVSFIKIPGNIDMAVKGNTLYADLFSDLLAIDISDPLHAKLSKDIPAVFPDRLYGSSFINDTAMFIIDWITKDTTVNYQESPVTWGTCENCVLSDAMYNSSKAGAVVPGIGGSMARFAVMNDYLYTVNTSSLRAYDISDPMNPVGGVESNVGRSIETIYPFEDKLFIGSSSGIFIYNTDNPSAPERDGAFSHARSCDPVVADKKYAFVTLRSGSVCEGTANQLDVLDINDVRYPDLIKSYPLSNPHGLAVDDNMLFICDGKDGLKIFDATDVTDLQLKKHLTGMEAFDVIAWDNKLILVAANGLYQYDYSNINNIRLISTIASGLK